MNKNEMYLELLKNQFCAANGYKKFDDNSKEMLKDLEMFIKDRQSLGEKYADFLKYIGIDITTTETAEVNKCNLDSIIKPYNTMAVTPYSIDIDKNRVFNGKFVSTEKGPIMQLKVNEENLNVIAGMPIKFYMTQNPYNYKEIKGFEYLYNLGNYDFILGMYGKTYDLDMQIKLKQLEKIEHKLKDLGYKTAFLKDNFNYYSVLYTQKYKQEELFKKMNESIERYNNVKNKVLYDRNITRTI